MNNQFIRGAGIVLICSMVALAGCSQSASDQADDAQAQLEQANNNLEQAQQEVDQAKQQIDQDNASKQAQANAAADSTAADDEVAKAEAGKKAADDKLVKARAEKQAAAKKQADARAESEAATQHAQTEQRQQAQANDEPVCNDCGTISSITPVTRNAQSGSGVGAVAGGVAGGLLGSQIGHGTGKTIASIAGALGGAYAGNVAEKHVRKVTVYNVNVAMDAGGSQSVTVDSASNIGTGTRVQVQGNNIVLMQ